MPDTQLHQDLRAGVRALCDRYPTSYWRELDRTDAYPKAFVDAMTEAGYLSALIPEEYGGSGPGSGGGAGSSASAGSGCSSSSTASHSDA